MVSSKKLRGGNVSSDDLLTLAEILLLGTYPISLKLWPSVYQALEPDWVVGMVTYGVRCSRLQGLLCSPEARLQIIQSVSRCLSLSTQQLGKKWTGLRGKAKSHSSQQWISRHIADPYVKLARAESYRARSAFKLLEIDSRYRLLQPGHVVIDCGAAPGSWTQVAVEKTNSAFHYESKPRGTVVAVDLLHMEPIEGAILVDQSDFTHHETQAEILTHLNNELTHVFLSDMAPNATGLHSMDHDQIVALVRTAMGFAMDVLRENGHFLAKLWDGHDTGLLKRDLAKSFRGVKILRPDASRKESSEIYLLAQGFKRYLVHPVT